MDYEASNWPLTSVRLRCSDSLRPYLPLPGATRTAMQTKNTNHDLQVPEYPGRCVSDTVQPFPAVDPGLLRDEPGSSGRPYLPPKPSSLQSAQQQHQQGCRPLPPYKDPPPLPETLPPGSLPPTETVPGVSTQKPIWTNTSGPRADVEASSEPRIPYLSQAIKQHQQQQQSRSPKERSAAPPPVGPKMDAWAQEEKGQKANMTERLGSLQNRLRSLLIHGPAETRRSEKVTQLPATKSLGGEGEKLIENQTAQMNGIENPALTTHLEKPQHTGLSSGTMSNRPLPLPGSTGQETASAVTGSQREPRPTPPHKHPHQPPNHTEDERCADHQTSGRCETRAEETDHLRDACSKLFGRDTGQYWNNYATLYSQGRNLKAPFEADKITEKETIIGPPSNQVQQQHHSHSTQQQHQLRHQEISQVQYLLSSEEISRREPTSTSTPKPLATITPASGNGADAGSDQGVKSSSESGRGTYLGSTPKTSSVQLDSSLDSDQSVGALWRQRAHSPFRPEEGGLHMTHKAPHHHHHQHYPWSSEGHLDHLDVEGVYAAAMMDGACSESTALSLTPPLPPTTPPNGSPNLGQGRMTKKSASSPVLASTYGVPETLRLQGGRSHAPDVSVTKQSTGRTGKRSSGTGGRKSACPPGSTYRMWEQGKMRKGSSTTMLPGRGNYPLPSTTGHQAPGRGYATYDKSKDYKIQLVSNLHDLGDGDVTSTTTALDMESLLDEEDEEEDNEGASSDFSCSVMTEDTEGATGAADASGRQGAAIHKQIQGLESMYGEILKLLGVRGGTGGGRSKVGSTADLVKASRRPHRHYGSFSSLTGRPSGLLVSGSRQRDRRNTSHGERTSKHSRDSKNSPMSKRLQRLESHVVTLARSVAHLSSEMRTQHMLVQELENIRQDLSWVHEQLSIFGANYHHKSRSGALRSSQHHLGQPGQGQQVGHAKDWERFRCEILELINPGRVRKLTKFFGDEPPLLRQFLKKLGYEKYASNFEAEKIGITELPYLTEERLQKIGIPMGPRVRILQEAQQSFRQDHLNIYIV